MQRNVWRGWWSSRRRPWSLVLFPTLLGLILGVCVVGLVHHTGPERLTVGFAGGLRWLTGQHLSIGLPEEAILLFLVLILLRRFRLDVLAVRPGPIEVRPLEDASGEQVGLESPRFRNRDTPETREARLRRLNVEFRESLASSRLYQTTSVPGDLETERIIEVFKGTQPSGRLATLAGIWSYLWPTRAYVVTATLRFRRQNPRYGVSATVRRLPDAAVEIEPQWSSNFERALQRAAFAVTAQILPSTLTCENPPWSDWRNRGFMPTELLRHYQRAKRMVAERRYDEALSLYHFALRYDADNIHLRYDIGQIFERLQLYPDALMQYAEITERLFPVTALKSRKGRTFVRRSIRPRLSPHNDPFMMRYRYVTTLATAQRLAQELLQPDWEYLRNWLVDGGIDQSGDPLPPSRRPWRATELLDLRVRIAEHFDPVWQQVLGSDTALDGVPGIPTATGLAGLLVSVSDEQLTTEQMQQRLFAVEQYFLHVAKAEAALMVKDYRRYRRQWWWRPARSSLTVIAMRLAKTSIGYRIQRFEHRRRQAGLAPDQQTVWKADQATAAKDLHAIGYRESSKNWLEHYLVACFHALTLQGDVAEVAEHVRYAEAAVRALDRAQRCGDEAEFLTSKRYWLLAGDPDLAGLRHYECFRAFESRAYIQPQPSTRDSARYELFHYLREGLARGARQLEQLWVARAMEAEGPVPASMSTVETWFREERRAWEICARLGLFYQQWQTRSLALEGLRKLVSFYDGDVFTVPYPEAVRDYNLSPASAQARIDGMEAIFTFMADKLGSAALDPAATGAAEKDELDVINTARDWIRFTEDSGRGEKTPPGGADLAELCRRQAAVWTALRQWIATPTHHDGAAFMLAVRRLPKPPDQEPSANRPRPGRAPDAGH
ncbi:MAG TPA: hypothetical protein VLL08_16135 [Kineosporiaceae bacterium]|nr:hypothetical protein [Kineosporiaceae bacterium]